MLRHSIFVSLAALAACGSAERRRNVLPPASKAILEKPDRLEVLSLQPPLGPAPDATYDWHGCRVLGRVPVDSAADRERVRDGVRDLLAGWDGRIAACEFSPRHAVVATSGSETLELLLCFQCGDVKIESPRSEASFLHMSERGAGLFDEILTRAGVPLAPK